MVLSGKTSIAALAGCLLWLAASAALAQQLEVLWLGHATFRITSPGGKVIVIDPFLKRNPGAPARYRDLSALGKVDAILVTHGHPDHILDLEELARITGATVIANYELANNLVALGLISADKTVFINKGGTVAIGAIKVHMVPAEHSSSIDILSIKPDTKGSRYLEGGAAVGYVIEFENGFKIYDTGDTDLFSDMSLIGRFYKPDLALICIGGHFTMDPEKAAYALRELIRPKQAIPMHYGTFPAINRTPAELRAALGNAPIKVVDMKPGDTVRF